MSSGLEDFSLFDLFRMEAEEQVRALQAHLLELEGGAATAAPLESLMRASHSLKGAARIVGLDAVVHLTHAMEDRFVAAQAGQALTSSDIDLMLQATDWLAKLQAVPEGEITGWLESNATVIEACTAKLHGAPPGPEETPTTPAQPASPDVELRAEAAPVAPPKPIPPVSAVPPRKDSPPAEDIFAQRPQDERATRERTVRMAAERFDNLVSLSAEVLVTARQLTDYGEVLERNRRLMVKAAQAIEDAESAPDVRNAAQRDIEAQIAVLSAHLADLDQAVHANEHTAERLYRAALAGRLRPFSEGVTGIAR
ncbi:MAG TPA: Hpt domain-containing protein, partial [Terracidiphilus sp.]|nr:Hpt domain-containing protein [Terracidiphilus sp.]